MLTAQPQVKSIWLFGSRAMGREQPGSDLDLCLEAPQLSHSDRLRLLNAVDDLCLPWQVDLVLRLQLDRIFVAMTQPVIPAIRRTGQWRLVSLERRLSRAGVHALLNTNVLSDGVMRSVEAKPSTLQYCFRY